MRSLLLLAAFGFSYSFAALPLVDPGLFVISGVQTCGNGNGYCLLGLDCTLDEDFVPDDLQGHCEGLKYAFTPSAHFVCCKAANLSVDHPTMIFPGEESEEVTGKENATTPNVLENEIETMLLKLAESINAAKKNTSKITEETESEEDTGFSNGTETSEEEIAENFGAEMMTESYEEMEDMSGENLTTPDLSGDQQYGENNTNPEAEWVMNNTGAFDHREDIINKVTIKSDLDAINDVVISTLDRNEQLNNIDSFYSIMQKEIEHLLGEGVQSANDSVEVPTVPGQGYNQSVIPTVNANANNTGTSVESGVPTVPLEGHYRCADKHECVSVRFMYEDNQVCFGAILSDEWVLTSASCALRIFRLGMQNITTQRLNTSEQVSLRTIVVHENYRESQADSSQIGANNIGLIRIKNPVKSWRSCLPCLPYMGQDFSGNNCSALFNYTRSQRRQLDNRSTARVSGNTVYKTAMLAASPLCTGAVQPLVGEYGNVSFLTLACGTSWRRRDNNIPNESGAPLLCNGVLAGIETSSGIGTLVYTPVSRYMGWLVDNAKPPTQAFYDE